MHAYRVAYDGSSFHGFQRQPDVPTVSDTLLNGLRELGVTDDIPTGYAAAGRTDAGVSALAQTVAFEAPPWLSPTAFNSVLPESVRVWARADVPATFHATHDAERRQYEYFVYAPAGPTSDFETACHRLAGCHDFHNFTPDTDQTVRTVSITTREEPPFVVLTVEADGFSRQLVRRLSAVLGAVLRGEAELSWIDRLLDDASVSGPDGVAPASPLPLVLTDVSYPTASFTPAADVGTVFADRAQSLAARTKVLDRIAAGVAAAARSV